MGRHSLFFSLFLLIVSFSIPLRAQEYVEGEVIVKYRDSSRSSASQKSEKLSHKGITREQSWDNLGLHHYKGRPGATTQDLINDLKSDPDVEFVEPNYILHKQGGEIQGQVYSSSQVNTFVTGFGLTSPDLIQGVEGWGEASSANYPIVAIIDTGIDLYHTALQTAIWQNTGEIPGNGIDDDHNGFVDDIYGWNFADGNNSPQDCDGHGTHVAGIVKGTTNSLFASPEPAPIIKLMAVKFLGCDGSGTTSNAVSAINYAVRMGAKVLNNSWGGGGFSQALQDSIIASYNARTIFVAAAGNSSQNNDSTKTYPASYDVYNVLSVASTSDSDVLSYFSNYGVHTVQIASPGEWILSSYIGKCGTESSPQSCYGQLSGTSMATPFVSGVAALIANEQPTMTGYQIKQIILGNGDPVPGLSGRVASGRRLNSKVSVAASKVAVVDPNQPAYSKTISADDSNLAGALASGGAGCGLVKAISSDSDKNGKFGPTSGPGAVAYTLILLLPLAFARWFHSRASEQRRAHPRFAVQARVTMSVGGMEYVGQMSSVSAGGVGVSSTVAIAEGADIKMKMQLPDGEVVEVDGRVVWSSKDHRYGVEFQKASAKVLNQLAHWLKLPSLTAA